MQLQNISAVVTGGASGLGFAAAQQLNARGVPVVIVDLSAERGEAAARQLSGQARFVQADILDTAQLNKALDAAEAIAPLRVLVHGAGISGAMRIVEKDGEPGSLEHYEQIIRVNLIGSFNTLRLAAARMARHPPVAEERGVCVLTASIAAYEGQIGQAAYASSKAGVAGLTLVAARDLVRHQIRVCTIAPGLFETPILAGLSEKARQSLNDACLHPPRLGHPDEFAALALHILENPMLNGETIRLDGALRMAPR